jgi:hypothetical protein
MDPGRWCHGRIGCRSCGTVKFNDIVGVDPGRFFPAPILLVPLGDTVNNSNTVVIRRDETELYGMFAIQLSILQSQTRY